MNDSDTMCEYIGCDKDGWVVLHFGPKLTPPLRIACMTHRTVSDLDAFLDRHSTGVDGPVESHGVVSAPVPTLDVDTERR